VEFATPVRHLHSVETYGLVFQTKTHSFSYIADTRYFDALTRSYSGELLIINVVRLESGHPWEHLSVADAETIIGAIKPKAALLTHFGMTMWRAKPWEVATQLSTRTGVRVIAARDGMTFDLASLEAA
jgi:phosphoribosyl 1,2-cyclic phosphodiesterase